MHIRRVAERDLKGIKELADSLVVTPDSEPRRSGFYDYSLSLEQYQRRVESPFFVVAESSTGLDGFSMAYDTSYIARLREKESQLSEDDVFKYLASVRTDFAYIDQLAIRTPRSVQGGVALNRLADQTVEQATNAHIQHVMAVIAHSPWKNQAGVHMAEKFNFKLIEEITTKRGILLGVYNREL